MTHANAVRDCIIYQTDPRLPWPMRFYGCRVRVLLAIPEFIAGRCLTHEQINELVDRGLNTPNVINHYMVRDGKRVPAQMVAGSREDLLINWSFATLGIKRHGRQVGWEPVHEETRGWQYMIAHWETGGLDGHFTLHDRRRELLFDPWNPDEIGSDLRLRRIVRKLYYATWDVAA